jgi:hypothetical protein
MIDEANKSFFDPAVGACTIPGPLDDDIIKYRVAYDPVLASIERKRIINVSGRS